MSGGKTGTGAGFFFVAAPVPKPQPQPKGNHDMPTPLILTLATFAMLGIGGFFGFWIAATLSQNLITDAYLRGRRDSDENIPPA